ncbi:hypothetical protein CROQUDRAFT_36382, partial [Cronartium quercuum f. sp. fusiforme G11]
YLRGLIVGISEYNPCAPPDGPIPVSEPGDAPFSQGQRSYEQAISCPYKVKGPSRGTVLLVPCTSCDPAEFFGNTHLGVRLPKAGFEICWVDIPCNSLCDMQLSAEFVAYAIGHLAARSRTGKIHVVSYSQGGANTQWALTFWPSLRSQVINLVTISAPLKGLPLLGPLGAALNLIGGSLPPLLQMAKGSRYMNALNHKTNVTSNYQAHVPSTSIFTYHDEFVFPQTSGSEGASHLAGASNIAVQDVCGRMHVVDHFGMLVDLAAYGLVLDALTHGRPASVETFDRGTVKITVGRVHVKTSTDKSLREFAIRIPLWFQAIWRSFVGNAPQRVRMFITMLKGHVPTEPPMMKYVCNRGHAPEGTCSPLGFCGNRPR